MNDVSHVMKKHQQPVTESQTLDGASCCYSSQRSKVVAAVGRLRLRASSRCYCRVRTTRRRQLKAAAAPSSTQHNIVQDFFGGQRWRRRLRVVLFSVLATILTLGKRGLGWKIESRWSFEGLLTLKRLNENVFLRRDDQFWICSASSLGKIQNRSDFSASQSITPQNIVSLGKRGIWSDS